MLNNNKVSLQVTAILFILLMSGCVVNAESESLPEPVESVIQYTSTPSPSAIPTATPSRTPTPTATLNPLVTLTSTPDPFLELYIDSLKTRNYGGGVLEDVNNVSSPAGFTRKIFKYRSEGLDLFGFINIPEGEGPFPVILVLHGYVEPAEYRTLDYTVRYTDALAEAGYITIHPNLRGYADSENGENIFGIGDTIDTLNLLELIRQQAGSEGMLKRADANRIGVWGHSMGGGITARILVIDREVKAGLLYASIHMNEEFNLAHFEKDGRGNEKIRAPSSALSMISPLNYLDEISAAVSIHHGELDLVVPVKWSQDLCEEFIELEKDVECHTYAEQAHTFRNSGDDAFIREVINFYDRKVK